MEKSRGEDNQIHLSNTDMMSLTGKPGSGSISLASSSVTSSSLAASSSASATSTSTGPASGSQCKTIIGSRLLHFAVGSDQKEYYLLATKYFKFISQKIILFFSAVCT